MPKLIYAQNQIFDPSILRRSDQAQFDHDEYLADLKKKCITHDEDILKTKFQSKAQMIGLYLEPYPCKIPDYQEQWSIVVSNVRQYIGSEVNNITEMNSFDNLDFTAEEILEMCDNFLRPITLKLFSINGVFAIWREEVMDQVVKYSAIVNKL